MKEIRKATSLCPDCLEVVPALLYEENGEVWMKKSCEEHGEFKDLYWSSYELYRRAERHALEGKGLENPNVEREAPSCPQDCGLCRLHKSHTALANIVVTNRCNLSCFYCFFYAEKLGYVYEPTLEQIGEMVNQVRNERPIPCNAVQLTGGEPCVRNDLLDIIKLVRAHGVDHVQLNTNGIKIAQDSRYARQVRGSGVNTLYMSFDGISEETNIKNHWEAPQAIENCRKAGLGIVLVPTVINNFNDHEVGNILKYGFKNFDVVRGIVFQPVSLTGRMPKKEREERRITIPDVIRRLEEQTEGQIREEDFFPVPSSMTISGFVESLAKKPVYELSSHFACGMATYVFQNGNELVPLTSFVDVDGFLDYLKEKAEELESGKSRILTSLKLLWNLGKFICKDKEPEGLDLEKLLFYAFIKRDYGALGKIHEKAFFIGMMHFMDLYNYDIERVKRCCIHYTMTDRRIIPFCAFNVIPDWYRDKNQESQGISIQEWEERKELRIKDDLYRRDREKWKRSEVYRKFINQLEEIRSS